MSDIKVIRLKEKQADKELAEWKAAHGQSLYDFLFGNYEDDFNDLDLFLQREQEELRELDYCNTLDEELEYIYDTLSSEMYWDMMMLG